ncbi:MAG: hypothetical protein ROY99_08990 [Ignavibacterium sp.]|jgi:hypothetical protein|nr:hypothetical protein [Ignavibacterium sp.]
MRLNIMAGNEGMIFVENSIIGAAFLINKNMLSDLKAVAVPTEII